MKPPYLSLTNQLKIQAVSLRALQLLLVSLSIGLPTISLAQSEDPTAQTGFTADVPRFEEVSIAAGITHRYEGPWEYFVGGGVSTFDCNQDRLPDVFLAGGVNDAQLFINRSLPASALQFEALNSASLALDKVTGSYPVDINNDGFLDLVVLRVGENQLLKGGPDCSFTRANTEWGFEGGNAWTTSFSATFEKGYAYPTLAFGNYVDRDAEGSPFGTCHDNELHRPDTRDGRPNYTALQALTPGYCALSIMFTDWNKSGVDALRITNDRQYYQGGQEQLWRVDSERDPTLYTEADGWEKLIIWGMGIAEADLNADGYPEYALTSMADTKLQVLDQKQANNKDRPRYTDMAGSVGATAHRPYTGDDLKPSTGWHAQFEDVNNDSYPDLFITKGNVEAMDEFALYDPDNLLLGAPSGDFAEQGLAAGVALDRRGRGASIVDMNADGLLDIIVVNRGDNVSLFQHRGMLADHTISGGGNWLKLGLSQPGGNRHAVGATLLVKTDNHLQRKRIHVGAGHASGTAGFVHLGLGVAERATVQVQWPDGEWGPPLKLLANHHALVERGKVATRQWLPESHPTHSESD